MGSRRSREFSSFRIAARSDYKTWKLSRSSCCFKNWTAPQGILVGVHVFSALGAALNHISVMRNKTLTPQRLTSIRGQYSYTQHLLIDRSDAKHLTSFFSRVVAVDGESGCGIWQCLRLRGSHGTAPHVIHQWGLCSQNKPSLQPIILLLSSSPECFS